MSDLNQWNQVAGQNVNLNQLDALVTAFKERREIYDKAKEAAEKEYERVKEIEGVILKILTDAKKSQYKVDGVGLVSVVNKYVIQVPKTVEELRALYDYIVKNHGLDVADAMFKVHSATLTSFYNAEKEASPDPAFSLPGVEAPTLMQSLRLLKK